MPAETAAPVLALAPEAIKSTQNALALYESAFSSQTPLLKRVALRARVILGLAGLMAFAWAEPFSGWAFASLAAAGAPIWLLDYALRPLVMVARGVLLVESFGYMYHRFFQHLGWLTRRAMWFRRNQRFHWIHHMILYPIGRFYKRDIPYVSSEDGLGLSWAVPSAVVIGAAFATMGLNLGTFVFCATAAGYAYFVIDDVHARFHLEKHSYAGTRYFKWLEEIHILHHWDQRMNFTIVHPAMDWLFGTYLAPREHQREIQVAIEDLELTVSDLTNWRYLLIEASPAEYAAFISEARRHPRSLRKIGHLLEVMGRRLEARPDDALARMLKDRAVDLLNLIRSDKPVSA